MSTITEIKVPEPLISVQSRVSWGALLAGSVVAIAIYSLLTMLGIAVGFSVSDRLDADQLGTGAAVWAFVTLLIGMFFGGWVATRCTAGELRTEAILYGIIVWGDAANPAHCGWHWHGQRNGTGRPRRGLCEKLGNSTDA